MSHMFVTGPMEPAYAEVLTDEALDFVARLHSRFLAGRRELLADREARRSRYVHGIRPDFAEETRAIREDDSWKVAGAAGAPGLERRVVELTGTAADGRTAVNALNSDADTWLADLEDAMSPTWDNVVSSQINLRAAVRRELKLVTRVGKYYEMTNPTPPTIVLRPRGLHMAESHLRYVDDNGADTSAIAALVDAGLYLFHNAAELIERGSGPYLCLAKLESATEARWWNDVFCFAQEELGLEHGTIRATILIETLQSAFEMEEMLYELRDHAAGLHAGRWDYIFSVTKAFRHDPEFVLPDRKDVTMTVPFMRAYTELMVATCHRRGAYVLGGMSTAFPDREDPERTADAQARVREDKEREAADGFDGTWVAHPTLIPVAREAFEEVLDGRPHQLDRLREDVRVTAEDLLSREGLEVRISEEGVRTNVRVCLAYLNAWISGQGALKVDHLVEDVSSAEISRSQIWQWIRHGVKMDNGRVLTRALVDRYVAEELAITERDPLDHYCDAADIFRWGALEDELPEFFTTEAYARFVVDRKARGRFSTAA